MAWVSSPPSRITLYSVSQASRDIGAPRSHMPFLRARSRTAAKSSGEALGNSSCATRLSSAGSSKVNRKSLFDAGDQPLDQLWIFIDQLGWHVQRRPRKRPEFLRQRE